jgi:hypothetical protein
MTSLANSLALTLVIFISGYHGRTVYRCSTVQMQMQHCTDAALYRCSSSDSVVTVSVAALSCPSLLLCSPIVLSSSIVISVVTSIVLSVVTSIVLSVVTKRFAKVSRT